MAVIINGRTAVHKESKGTLVTQDDCYTGPNKQVVTYQNIAKSEDAGNCAKTVFINGNPICHKNSYFSKSTGDEAGDGGGVKSGTIQGKAEFVTASPNVFIEGIPAVRAGDLMVSNNRNTPPAALQQASPPFGGDQDKINKFPLFPYDAVKVDLSNVTRTVKTEIWDYTLSLNGSVTLKKEGEHNPLTFNRDGYEIEAKKKVGDYFSDLMLLDVSGKNATIGSAITGDTTLASVRIGPKNTYIFSGEITDKEQKFEGWAVSPALEVQLTVTKKDKTQMNSKVYVAPALDSGAILLGGSELIGEIILVGVAMLL